MKELVTEGNLQSTGKHKIIPNLRKSNIINKNIIKKS